MLHQTADVQSSQIREGTYAWRSYENSKQRPLAVVAIKLSNNKLKGKI